MHILFNSFVALVSTLFCIWLVKPLAVRIGLVDRPGGRKTHRDDIPLVGGISMFLGFYCAFLTMYFSLRHYEGMIVGSSLLMIVGVLDDFYGLSSRFRLLIQILSACLLIVWGHEIVSNLGNILFMGNVKLGLWAFPLTAMFIVGYINAMNMMDGQDGLAGGIALGQILLLAFLSLQLKHEMNFNLLIILAVVLCVFLSFNMRLPWRKSASIFMGDAGITFVAFLIAWFAVDLAQTDNLVVHPITILWILALPLFDLVSVVSYRLLKGASPFQPSNDHLHHVLNVYGFAEALSSFLLGSFSVGLGLVGILLNYFSIVEAWQFLLYLVFLVIYVLVLHFVRAPIAMLFIERSV